MVVLIGNWHWYTHWITGETCCPFSILLHINWQNNWQIEDILAIQIWSNLILFFFIKLLKILHIILSKQQNPVFLFAISPFFNMWVIRLKFAMKLCSFHFSIILCHFRHTSKYISIDLYGNIFVILW